MATKLTTILDQLANGIGLGLSGGTGTYITGRLIVSPLYDESLLNVNIGATPHVGFNDRVVISGANLSIIGSLEQPTPYLHIYDRNDAGHTQFFSSKIYRSQTATDFTLSNFDSLIVKSHLGSGEFLAIYPSGKYVENQYIDQNVYIEYEDDLTGTLLAQKTRVQSIDSGQFINWEVHTLDSGTLKPALKIQTSGHYLGVFHETPTFGIDVSGSGIRVVNPDGGESVLILTSPAGYEFAIKVLDNGILYTQRIA